MENDKLNEWYTQSAPSGPFSASSKTTEKSGLPGYDCECCEPGPTSTRPTPSRETITDIDAFRIDVLMTSDEAVDILLKKHEDYGPDNINNSPFGASAGLVVRLYDKVARLGNLIGSGKEVNYESIRDTFLDISNYGLIGVLLADGKWDGQDKK